MSESEPKAYVLTRQGAFMLWLYEQGYDAIGDPGGRVAAAYPEGADQESEPIGPDREAFLAWHGALLDKGGVCEVNGPPVAGEAN